MSWFRSLQFTYIAIVLLAILFIPIAAPLTTVLTYVPGLWLQDEKTPYDGFNALEKMWHKEADALTGKPDAVIKDRLETLNQKYPKSQMFWVDEHGKTRDAFSYKGKLPKVWTVSYTIQFMKDSIDSEPFTVVAFLGKESDKGFMAIKVERELLAPPIQRLGTQYNYIYFLVLSLMMFIFVFLTSLFIKSIRRRLLRLRDSMQAKQDSGIPLPITLSKMDEIGQLESSFNRMVEELEEGRKRERHEEKLRRELISNLSHDLRTPLTTIRSHFLRIKDEVKSSEGRHAIDAIDKKIDFLSNLIDNLLSYTLLSGGKYPYNPKETDMNRFIRSAIAQWYPLLEQHGFGVVIQAAEEASYWHIDPNWMERIIDNLLQNVLRHGNHGKHVEISLTDNQLVIKDRGKGFSQESGQKGTGIGLVIIDLMVREMGLAWSIDSTERGTAITIKK